MKQCSLNFPLTATHTGTRSAVEKSQNIFHSPVTRKNRRISAGLCIHSQGEKPQQDRLQTFQCTDRTQQWQHEMRHVEMQLKASQADLLSSGMTNQHHSNLHVKGQGAKESLKPQFTLLLKRSNTRIPSLICTQSKVRLWAFFFFSFLTLFC